MMGVDFSLPPDFLRILFFYALHLPFNYLTICLALRVVTLVAGFYVTLVAGFYESTPLSLI